MSRIGKMPIAVPDKVTVDIKGQTVTVKGPLGMLKRDVHPKIAVKKEGTSVLVTRADDDRESRALHGLTRALLANMVTGVLTGFKRELELSGVGYRAELKGKELNMVLGFSHPITVAVLEGLTVAVKHPKIEISGADKWLVGEFAAKLCRLRKPDAYQGKGVRRTDVVYRKKAGKTAAGASK